MTTSTKTVTLVIPSVNAAWADLCKTGETTAKTNKTAIIALGNIVMKETASMSSIAQSIKDTGKESHIKGLTYSTVKALPTFVALSKSKAHKAEFNAMKLDKAITFANKCYDLLGKGKAEKIDTFANLETSLKNAQEEKTRKAKESKAETPKADTGKNIKKGATLTETLKGIFLMVSATDPSEWTDAVVAQFNEIQAVAEEKYMASEIDA